LIVVGTQLWPYDDKLTLCLVRFAHSFLFILISFPRFLSGSVNLFHPPSPVRQATRQCYVLSSAIPGHRPQALLNPSRPITLGTSHTSIWPATPFSRLSPLHKWQYTSSHAVPPPSPELHLTLPLSTLKWRCLRQRPWTTPQCWAGLTGKYLESDHHTPLAAAVTQMRGASLFHHRLILRANLFISSDDSCISIASSSSSCQCHGIPYSNKVCNSHNQSQQASTRNSNERIRRCREWH